jgi:hypothetical protein
MFLREASSWVSVSTVFGFSGFVGLVAIKIPWDSFRNYSADGFLGLAGAKALPLRNSAARLKPCPDTKPIIPPVAGAMPAFFFGSFKNAATDGGMAGQEAHSTK